MGLLVSLVDEVFLGAAKRFKQEQKQQKFYLVEVGIYEVQKFVTSRRHFLKRVDLLREICKKKDLIAEKE